MPGQSVTMIHTSLWNKHKGKQQQQKNPHHTPPAFLTALRLASLLFLYDFYSLPQISL